MGSLYNAFRVLEGCWGPQSIHSTARKVTGSTGAKSTNNAKMLAFEAKFWRMDAIRRGCRFFATTGNGIIELFGQSSLRQRAGVFPVKCLKARMKAVASE